MSKKYIENYEEFEENLFKKVSSKPKQKKKGKKKKNYYDQYEEFIEEYEEESYLEDASYEDYLEDSVINTQEENSTSQSIETTKIPDKVVAPIVQHTENKKKLQNIPDKVSLDPTTKQVIETSNPNSGKQNKKEPQIRHFVPGPNTINIKGVDIDFDGVVSIEKVENEKNNNLTYGIKFTFKGIKKPYRIIWYNDKIYFRDRDYVTYVTKWKDILGIKD